MSAQRLSDKSLRRIVRKTGLPALRGWAYGGYFFDVIVPVEGGHKHYMVDIKNWLVTDTPDATHYAKTCDHWDKTGELLP